MHALCRTTRCTVRPTRVAVRVLDRRCASQRDTAVQQFARLVEDDAQAVRPMLRALTPAARRRVAEELVRDLERGELRDTFNAADINKDGVLSMRELSGMLRRRVGEAEALEAAAADSGAASSSSAAATGATAAAGGAGEAAAEVVLPPARQQLGALFVRAAVPFVGFGFLDNAIMIVAGDYIDHLFGAALGLSVMAAAGLGNLVSDVAGIGMSRWIESLAGQMGLPDPKLSRAQKRLPACRWVLVAGSVVGISVGCLLGLLPLLFMGKDSVSSAVEKVLHSSEFRCQAELCFERYDTDKSGHLDRGECKAMLRELGKAVDGIVPQAADATLPDEETVDRVISQFDTDGDNKLDREEFVEFAKSVMRARVVAATRPLDAE